MRAARGSYAAAMPRLAIAALLAPLLAAPLSAAALRAQDSADAAEVAHALQRTTVLGSALYVAAHPDDENTALLAWLANERHYRTAYLSVTRGDGGQNLIGTEFGPLLGLIRTQELLAARRIDRAQQLFTRAIDFGYSKTPDETLRIWDRERVLGDVVWAIRWFRPDVVIARFPKTGEGGHGHHTSSAILAEEAFAAAADPARYPEQLAHVKPWQAKRVVWNLFRFGDDRRAVNADQLPTDVGKYNRLLGRSYTEIAGESRSQHKSQGFGAPERRGSRSEGFQHIAGEPAKSDLFDGVDTSWARVPGSEAVRAKLEEAQKTFQIDKPEAIVPILVDAWKELLPLAAAEPWAATKQQEIAELARRAGGLWIEAMASAHEASPGDEVEITMNAVSRGAVPAELFPAPHPWNGPGDKPTQVPPQKTKLTENQPFSVKFKMVIPKEAPITQPHWLASAAEPGVYTVDDPRMVHEPDVPEAITLGVGVSWNGGPRIVYPMPVKFRWVDPVKGEQLRPFVIAPRVTVQLDRSAYLFGGAQARPVVVNAVAHSDGVQGVARLRLPEGWKAEPAEAPLRLAKRGDEQKISFVVTPAAEPIKAQIAAEVEVAGQVYSRGLIRIEHDHIPIQTWFSPAQAPCVRLDLKLRGERVGYVMGAGDDAPQALEQMGYAVTLLDDEALESGDLSRFDSIVLGVRAYDSRKRLKVAQPRLLEYVERGGTLVVQYNTERGGLPENLGPYPLKVVRTRVTDETAKPQFVMPKHAVLTEPNPITAADFDGWVQERGLYFVDGFDPEKYEAPLEFADPGEKPSRGALVAARHGKGIFVYTSLAFFRQLPAGVPGAYRLFANLVSARAPKN